MLLKRGPFQSIFVYSCLTKNLNAKAKTDANIAMIFLYPATNISDHHTCLPIIRRPVAYAIRKAFCAVK